MKDAQPFFVTGLPRTRSAWFSNLLTTNTTICHHDVAFDDTLLVSPRRVGFSGSELVMQYEQIAKDYPKAPWVIVIRSLVGSAKSLKAWAGKIIGDEQFTDQFLREREIKVLELAGNRKNCVAFFDELGEESVCRRVWKHLLPDIDFDIERWRLLEKLNVQQQKPSSWTT